MVTTFSTYCKRKFEVEPVEVISFDGNSSVYPDLSEYNMEVPLSYITGYIGVPLEADEVTNLLKRMQLNAERAGSGTSYISVSVPPTRSDILHPCYVMEVMIEGIVFHGCIFEVLNRKEDKSTAVIIGNPGSSDFEVVHTSLMPGMLKTVGHNKDHPKPIKIHS
ncbi:phenylalanine--tRNA ligase beta subunit, cytoplasmic-like [Hibiscus syriacus]|uniref:phenylalanine--tRNA ligase beta subunit, cytoplasmic-like n=1 Tax=Hibiscus syriacus TaxID=106335 RepID=UPI0019208BEA|nr:phenylalanine--tRNA ligase beta subunit, cytoplasmic-like [Hibiscus syriacus]